MGFPAQLLGQLADRVERVDEAHWCWGLPLAGCLAKRRVSKQAQCLRRASRLPQTCSWEPRVDRRVMTQTMDEDRPTYKIIAILLIVLLAAGVLTYGYSTFFVADEAVEEVEETID